MPRRAAAVTQADLARALRAADAAGWGGVRVTVRDGVPTIEFVRRESQPPELADEHEVERYRDMVP